MTDGEAVGGDGARGDAAAAADDASAGSVASGRAPCPTPGRYRHYKGAEYRVLGCVRHSESEEWLVLYRALYGERGLWVRPLAMFVGDVDADGRRTPRFALLSAGEGLVDD